MSSTPLCADVWSCVIQAIVTTTSYHRQARIVFYIICAVYIQLHSIWYSYISAEWRLCLFQQVNNKCSQGLRKLISLHNANYVKQEWKSLLEQRHVFRTLLDWFIANECVLKWFQGIQLGEKCTHQGSFSLCIEKSSNRCWKRERNAPGKKTT